VVEHSLGKGEVKSSILFGSTSSSSAAFKTALAIYNRADQAQDFSSGMTGMKNRRVS
jgi:hypothetical protein